MKLLSNESINTGEVSPATVLIDTVSLIPISVCVRKLMLAIPGLDVVQPLAPGVQTVKTEVNPPEPLEVIKTSKYP